MESVAAERLTKIGKNPSIVSSRADLDEDQRLLNEIVMESTPVVTSASEDEDKDSDDSSGSSKSAKHKKKFKLDFSAKLHRITEERKSRSRENLKDVSLDSKFRNILRKAPSGPNLFGLLAPPGFSERKRSGSVGANLGMIMENFSEDSPRKKRDDSLGNKFFTKVFDGKDIRKRKSGSKTSVCDESPTSDGHNMQFLTVPTLPDKATTKSKEHISSSPTKCDKKDKDSPSPKSVLKSDSSKEKSTASGTSAEPTGSSQPSKTDRPMQVNFSLTTDTEDSERVPLTASEPSEPSTSRKSSTKKRHVDFEEAQLIPFNVTKHSEDTDKLVQDSSIL